MKKILSLLIILFILGGCSNKQCEVSAEIDISNKSVLDITMQNYFDLDQPAYKGVHFEIKPIYYVVKEQDEYSEDYALCSVMFLIAPRTNQMFDYAEITLIPDENFVAGYQGSMPMSSMQRNDFGVSSGGGTYWEMDYTPFTEMNTKGNKFVSYIRAGWGVPKEDILKRLKDDSADIYQRELTMEFTLDNCTESITFQLPELINYSDANEGIKNYVDSGQGMGPYNEIIRDNLVK